MGSRCHGNDEGEPGMGSRCYGNDGGGAWDGFPLSRERRGGAGESPSPRIEYGAGSASAVTPASAGAGSRRGPGGGIGEYEAFISINIMLGAGGRLNPQGPPCQSRLGRVTPVPQLSQSRPHGGFDETEQHRRNSSPAGCAGLGGPRGGAASCGECGPRGQAPNVPPVFSALYDHTEMCLRTRQPGVNIGDALSRPPTLTRTHSRVRQHADLQPRGARTRRRSTSTLRPASSAPRPPWTTRIRMVEATATATATW